ncbi:MAG: site-specific DNA-methyltransferase [Desulfobacteraceae bacterium]|nr:MAG: site-specific DNA-methyltransferase [Desulfobacteraceae bacterium]
MHTHHRIIIGNAAAMKEIDDHTIDLVVTSPPYPMIQMWDELFASFDPAISELLSAGDGDGAFEQMHSLLDLIWEQLARVVKPGGTVCINIGDAVRTLAGEFRLFANHVRVMTALQSLGFTPLPLILWRKPTNAPNKFMGSGMLPPSAYVTLEHEFILIFRRSGKRAFESPEEKKARHESAYFWEERNQWFSDVWFNLIGTTQKLHNGKSRERSAAFPLEIPGRLIHMFSLKGDTVLDPFLGTGTTLLAAMIAGRHSVGFEVDQAFQDIMLQRIAGLPQLAGQIIEQRLQAHADFIRNRLASGGSVGNINRPYNVPVVTRQEQELFFDPVRQVQFIGNDRFKVTYGAAEKPAEDTCLQPEDGLLRIKAKGRQLKLF